MVGFESTVVIRRPVEEVFLFVTTPENDVRWKGSVTAARAATAAMGVGTTWRQRVRLFVGTAETLEQCTLYQRNEQFGQQCAQPLPHGGQYQFKAVDGGTQVHLSGYFELKGGWKLASPLIRSISRRMVKAELGQLKRVLEAEAPAPESPAAESSR